MDIITKIEYCILTMLEIYLFALGIVWVCEFKKNNLYRHMREQSRLLENLGLSMAVLHAKLYKIDEDYHQRVLRLERVQQFILKNVLLIGGFQRLSVFDLKTNRR